jgi:hypothetical protein
MYLPAILVAHFETSFCLQGYIFAVLNIVTKENGGV